MQIHFDKMEGAGNDFILVDNRAGDIRDADKVRLVTECCRRRFGIGADGVIFVENDPEYTFAWDLYNADGTRPEMCGNGARCAALYANRIGAAGPRMTFRSLAGPVRAELTGRGVKIGLPDASVPAGADAVNIAEDFVRAWSLDTGSPHAVVKVPDLAKVDVESLGRQVRHNPRYAPAGTNVDFFSLSDGNRLSVRTYERGVEGETLACCTGSVAACIVAASFFSLTPPVTVATHGGGELVVHFRIEGDRAVDIFLEGDARLVFSGSFTL